MKKYVLVLIIVLMGWRGYAQNLVQNYSFENFTTCPNNLEQIDLAFPWNRPFNSVGTTDYYNSCSAPGYVGVPSNLMGDAIPRSGAGYAGFINYDGGLAEYREYLEVELSNTLVVGQAYCVSFYVQLADYSHFAADGIGAYLSVDSVGFPSFSYTFLPYTPQIQNTTGNIITDTANWVLIQGSYNALDEVKYITIGNFKTDALTNNIPLPWNTLIGGIAYYYIDDVSVVAGPCAVGVAEHSIKEPARVYPNPSNGVFTLAYHPSSPQEVLYLKDVSGKTVFMQQLNNMQSTHQINATGLSNGFYFYEVMSNDKVVNNGKIVIAKD